MKFNPSLAKSFGGRFLRTQNRDHDGEPGNVFVFVWNLEEDCDKFVERIQDIELAYDWRVRKVTCDYENGILTSCISVEE
jgi:hypothetical protein